MHGGYIGSLLQVSSHDALDDPRLSRERAVDTEELQSSQASAAESAGRRAAAQEAVASAVRPEAVELGPSLPIRKQAPNPAPPELRAAGWA